MKTFLAYNTTTPYFIIRLLIALCLGLASSWVAAETQGTLDKINKSGVIVMGHRESSLPFSYYDNDERVVGYSQDYSNWIVDAVKATLKRPDLQVKYIPITSQNRIPLLQNGTYDFECGSTTNNRARQEQVDFSNSIFIVGTRMLVKKDSGLRHLSDLKHKNVVVTAGTTSEVILNKLNSEQHLGIRIINLKDHSDSFRTLQSGRAEAFIIDDAILAAERARAKHPNDWEIVGNPLSYEAYGCMIRKDDPQFKRLVDNTIAKAQRSGLAQRSFYRWFKHPIPPKGLNMNFDLSPQMKRLFMAPNDRALDK